MIVTKLQISKDERFIIYPPYADNMDAAGTLTWNTEQVAAAAFPSDDYVEYHVERFLLSGNPCTF